jgi:hypothetical protein
VSGGLDAIGRGFGAAVEAVAAQSVFGCLALLLALVFLLSAVPKLRKPELAALAIVDFGVTKRSHRWAGVALGAGELVLAGSLAAAAAGSTAVRVVPAACAAVLLWIFACLIARALRSSERFACFCFGSADSTVSLQALLRTTTLAVVATVLSAGAIESTSPPSVEAWMLELTTAASLLGTAALLKTLPSMREVPHECS